MIQLSGKNTLQLPEVNSLYFVFDNLSISTTGNTIISFCNNSGITGLFFQLSGGDIFINSSGINKKINSYNINESFSISGYLISQTNNYNCIDYYLNDMHINAWPQFIPNNLYTLNINVSNNDILNIDAKLYSNQINFSYNLPVSYEAFNSFTGNIVTDTNFWILNCSNTFQNSYQQLLDFGSIIAPAKSNFPLILNISDNDNSSSDYSVEFITNLTANIGNHVLTGQVNRTGNEESILTKFRLLNSNTNISGLFDGIWSGNNFIYNDFPEYGVFNFEYSQMDTNGVYLSNQNILIKFEPSFPLNGQNYLSEYITGFNLSNSGIYQYPPDVFFNNYYYVTGISQLMSSMLFSSGCSGNIPITFLGAGGSGASGNLLLAQVIIPNLYIGGNAIYNIVTGININNYGENYTGSPIMIVNSGLYNNCYDVPNHYNSNLYSFTNINSSGLLNYQATSLTGLVLTITGNFNGIPGYSVTGLDITNIGHGYNNKRIPLCNFIRQSGDIFSGSGDAQGIFLLKNSGVYNSNNSWTIQTGWANSNLFTLESGFSGVLKNTQRFFAISVQSSGLDNTSGIISKLSVLPSYGSGIIQFITGNKYYNDDPYFLKKKLDIAKLLTPVSGDLSFFTTQSELDTIYADYTSNQDISLGDINF